MLNIHAYIHYVTSKALAYHTSIHVYILTQGVVEIYVDGDTSRAVTVNSLRANRRVSLIEYQRLCLATSQGGAPLYNYLHTYIHICTSMYVTSYT